LSDPHCIIAESLLNFVYCFRLGIPKFLTKLDAVSLLFHHLERNENAQTRVTPLHYLAATDASSGDARQQKITNAHESLFCQYAQFPHPFTITYRGGKI
jgi:hypothetical protein